MKVLAFVSSILLVLFLGMACGGGSGGGINETPPADLVPSTEIKLLAKNLKFDQKHLAIPPNADVVVILDNQDAGALHNFSFYRSKEMRDNVFRSELFTGRETQEVRFRSPEAGIYYFRCDAHPDMNGTLTVKAP